MLSNPLSRLGYKFKCEFLGSMAVLGIFMTVRKPEGPQFTYVFLLERAYDLQDKNAKAPYNTKDMDKDNLLDA